jgi:uncharacterized protein YjeT (DUF2065 family)
MSAELTLTQLLLTTLVVFIFVVSLLGLALGFGLIAKRSTTLSFIAYMNRWVSTHQALKRLEAPITVPSARAASRGFGLVLAAVGAYAALALLGSFDVPRLARIFGADARYSLAGIALELLKWVLVAGSFAAVVAGLMLLLFPRAWQRVETSANRWYATDRLELAGNAVYTPLERIVEARPRIAGAVICALSLLAAAASGVLLFRPG